MKEDKILIEQLNASSVEAFSSLYDKYAGMVYNFTLSILKDSCVCEDITQSCFALMWSRRAEFDPCGNLLPGSMWWHAMRFSKKCADR